MKTLKHIGIGFLALLTLLLIISFFLPAKIHIERSILIKAKPEIVFSLINDLRKWNSWSPWNQVDTTIQITYSDTSIGVGAYYTWASKNKNIETGSIKILQSIPFSFIQTKMDFMRNGAENAEFRMELNKDYTNLIWSMDTDMGMNPFAKFFGLFMDKMLGADFVKGLKNIDRVIAAMPKIIEVVYTIDTTSVIAMPCLTILDSANRKDIDSIGKKYSIMYKEIIEHIKKSKIKMLGMPFGIMIKTEDDKYQWEAGIPTDKLGNSSGRITAKNTYSGKVALLKYFGSYDKTKGAYEAINKWITLNNKILNGNSWEVYVTDPGIELDTAKWETDIYVPIKQF